MEIQQLCSHSVNHLYVIALNVSNAKENVFLQFFYCTSEQKKKIEESKHQSIVPAQMGTYVALPSTVSHKSVIPSINIFTVKWVLCMDSFVFMSVYAELSMQLICTAKTIQLQLPKAKFKPHDMFAVSSFWSRQHLILWLFLLIYNLIRLRFFLSFASFYIKWCTINKLNMNTQIVQLRVFYSEWTKYISNNGIQWASLFNKIQWSLARSFLLFLS